QSGLVSVESDSDRQPGSKCINEFDHHGPSPYEPTAGGKADSNANNWYGGSDRHGVNYGIKRSERNHRFNEDRLRRRNGAGSSVRNTCLFDSWLLHRESY